MTHKRARQYGFTFGSFSTGKNNSLTDVKGVKVGHQTLIKDTNIRTGVTAILPHGGNLFQKKVIGGSFVLNGFGKTTGLVQLEELGVIESPILLTNTFSVPSVTEGGLASLFAKNPEIGVSTGTANVIVAECNDGYLNDIKGMHVRPSDAMQAINHASQKNKDEGSIGAGTGMSCLGFKGGIGTSSRKVGLYTVGCLVLTNYGKKDDWQYSRHGERIKPKPALPNHSLPDGSIIIVLATDAPLDARQLKRLSKRGALGLGRTASYAANGSGDIILSFSTAHKVPHVFPKHLISYHFMHDSDPRVNQLFAASADAVEEAILNALCAAEPMTGFNGHTRASFTDAL